MNILNRPKSKNCLIIAEAGVNHNGNLDMALQLCDAAKTSGANVVKFQTWYTDKLITRSVKMADYQEINTGRIESQYDMLKKLELSRDDFKLIKNHCDEIGITFASTADDKDSLDFLIELGVPFIKVGSGDIGNVPFLRYMGSKGLPIILSTGMCSLADVDLSIASLRDGGAEDITLLHCTTNYPCSYEDVNLNAMKTLHNAFHLPVGYSDHTIGAEIAVSAVALGAVIVEKHFTLDCKMEGPDHQASTEPREFGKMVKQIRNVEMGLGNGIKQITMPEKTIKEVVSKRIVAARAISEGDVFSEDNLCVKRNDIGLSANYWDSIMGLIATRSYEIDEAVFFQ